MSDVQTSDLPVVPVEIEGLQPGTIIRFGGQTIQKDSSGRIIITGLGGLEGQRSTQTVLPEGGTLAVDFMKMGSPAARGEISIK